MSALAVTGLGRQPIVGIVSLSPTASGRRATRPGDALQAEDTRKVEDRHGMPNVRQRERTQTATALAFAGDCKSFYPRLTRRFVARSPQTCWTPKAPTNTQVEKLIRGG